MLGVGGDSAGARSRRGRCGRRRPKLLFTYSQPAPPLVLLSKSSTLIFLHFLATPQTFPRKFVPQFMACFAPLARSPPLISLLSSPTSTIIILLFNWFVNLFTYGCRSLSLPSTTSFHCADCPMTLTNTVGNYLRLATIISFHPPFCLAAEKMYWFFKLSWSNFVYSI